MTGCIECGTMSVNSDVARFRKLQCSWDLVVKFDKGNRFVLNIWTWSSTQSKGPCVRTDKTL